MSYHEYQLRQADERYGDYRDTVNTRNPHLAEYPIGRDCNEQVPEEQECKWCGMLLYDCDCMERRISRADHLRKAAREQELLRKMTEGTS